MKLVRRFPFASALLLGLAATACDGARQQEDPGAEVTVDSSGAHHVIRSSGTPAQWSAELVATISGDSSSSGEEGFGSVRSLLLDSAGSVYVLDPSFVQISVFDSTGALSRRVGRKGNGPGEYTLPYSIAWLGDSLAVLDPGNSRIMLVGPDGQWVRQWTSQRISGDLSVRLYRTLPRGFWNYGHKAGPDGRGISLFVRVASDSRSDTLAIYRAPEVANTGALCRHASGGLSFFGPPFGAKSMAIPNAGGEQYVALNTEYRIAVLGAAHDTLRVLERQATPAAVTDAEWEESLTEWRTFKEEYPAAHCDRDGWTRPATKPVLEHLFTDSDQQLWVEVLSADGRFYEVFGPDGRLRARVSGLPPSLGVDPSVVAGRAAFVVADSLGVQSVQVFRIRK